MSEIKFDSIDLKIEDKTITRIVEFNDTKIKVKQYLPIEDKLKLVEKVLVNVANNENNFVNPIHLDVYSVIEIIKTYSNIEFAEDANPAQLYDQLFISGLSYQILSAIPEEEYGYIMDQIRLTVEAYYKYKTSVLGILEAVSTDYSDLNFDATEIQKKIADPDNLTLLKDVMDKLG